ncbi:phage tail assembly chaperone [Pseudomonas atacamensis]|uniref:phage tail assembly chaperone n=1 Tax=Pseudomonas atacamensis TaxID=2565368 RepID=UPI0019CFE508|nr:phage tail assembly chaperone [Pseudomonas atacamensis]QSL90427.1 tail fiber assembly protein [Pseudomonas atacamensis]
MIFFSAKKLGFYDVAINDAIPEDCVKVSLETHRALMDGQSAGMVIAADQSGRPVLGERPPPSPDVLAARERAWRDLRLAETDGVVSRHRDEVEAGGATTLTAEQYTELQAYRQELRKWPQGEEFPLVDHRPVAPTWLVDGEVLL